MSCNKAPKGWHCTRATGHDGPCAAVKLPWYTQLLQAVGTAFGQAKFGE
jgi:hypothetical protein